MIQPEEMESDTFLKTVKIQAFILIVLCFFQGGEIRGNY